MHPHYNNYWPGQSAGSSSYDSSKNNTFGMTTRFDNYKSMPNKNQTLISNDQNLRYPSFSWPTSHPSVSHSHPGNLNAQYEVEPTQQNWNSSGQQESNYKVPYNSNIQPKELVPSSSGVLQYSYYIQGPWPNQQNVSHFQNPNINVSHVNHLKKAQTSNVQGMPQIRVKDVFSLNNSVNKTDVRLSPHQIPIEKDINCSLDLMTGSNTSKAGAYENAVPISYPVVNESYNNSQEVQHASILRNSQLKQLVMNESQTSENHFRNLRRDENILVDSCTQKMSKSKPNNNVSVAESHYNSHLYNPALQNTQMQSDPRIFSQPINQSISETNHTQNILNPNLIGKSKELPTKNSTLLSLLKSHKNGYYTNSNSLETNQSYPSDVNVAPSQFKKATPQMSPSNVNFINKPVSFTMNSRNSTHYIQKHDFHMNSNKSNSNEIQIVETPQPSMHSERYNQVPHNIKDTRDTIIKEIKCLEALSENPRQNINRRRSLETVTLDQDPEKSSLYLQVQEAQNIEDIKEKLNLKESKENVIFDETSSNTVCGRNSSENEVIPENNLQNKMGQISKSQNSVIISAPSKLPSNDDLTINSYQINTDVKQEPEILIEDEPQELLVITDCTSEHLENKPLKQNYTVSNSTISSPENDCKSKINREKLDLLIEFVEKECKEIEFNKKHDLSLSEKNSVKRKYEDILENHDRRKLSKQNIVKNKNNIKEMMVRHKTLKNKNNNHSSEISVKSKPVFREIKVEVSEIISNNTENNVFDEIEEKNFKDKGEMKTDLKVTKMQYFRRDSTKENDENKRESKKIKNEEATEIEKSDNNSNRSSGNNCGSVIDKNQISKGSSDSKKLNFKENNLLNTLKAFQKIDFHYCMACKLNSSNDSFWINAVSGELRCLNCFKKMVVKIKETNLNSGETQMESLNNHKKKSKKKKKDKKEFLIKEKTCDPAIIKEKRKDEKHRERVHGMEVEKSRETSKKISVEKDCKYSINTSVEKVSQEQIKTEKPATKHFHKNYFEKEKNERENASVEDECLKKVERKESEKIVFLKSLSEKNRKKFDFRPSKLEKFRKIQNKHSIRAEESVKGSAERKIEEDDPLILKIKTKTSKEESKKHKVHSSERKKEKDFSCDESNCKVSRDSFNPEY